MQEILNCLKDSGCSHKFFSVWTIWWGHRFLHVGVPSNDIIWSIIASFRGLRVAEAIKKLSEVFGSQKQWKTFRVVPSLLQLNVVVSSAKDRLPEVDQSIPFFGYSILENISEATSNNSLYELWEEYSKLNKLWLQRESLHWCLRRFRSPSLWLWTSCDATKTARNYRAWCKL